jgi:hypothetical protein
MSAIDQRGPAYNLLQRNNQLTSALPVRDTDSRRYQTEKRSVANEDGRSVRTERHYDKSTRSNRSQELKQDNKSVRSNSSQNQQRQSVQSSHDYNKYKRVSSSNVSQPDNLVCDNCINHKMHSDKGKDLANQRANDREHALRVNENLRKQLEDEKRKHLDKLKLYQDAIDQQKLDNDRKRAIDRENDAKEKEKIRAAMGKNDDLLALEAEEHRKKQIFIHDLKVQMELHEKLKIEQERNLLDADRQNHNLLIDDAWREPHRRLLQKHYKDNLLDQLKDKDAEKLQDKERRQLEDREYNQKLEELKNKDKVLRDKLEAQKKGIFQDELQNQLKEKAQLKDIEKQIKALEDQNYRDKIKHDNDVHLDNLFRKKKLQNEVLDKLGDQINENDLKRKLDKEDAKKPGLTSVPLAEKEQKKYDCKVCHHKYPIKMLNKKRKL